MEGEAMQKSRKKDRHTAEYSRNFDKVFYDHVNFKFRKDSGIMEALELACRITGMGKNQYIRDAVVDKLIDDGYMPEK